MVQTLLLNETKITFFISQKLILQKYLIIRFIDILLYFLNIIYVIKIAFIKSLWGF